MIKKILLSSIIGLLLLPTLTTAIETTPEDVVLIEQENEELLPEYTPPENEYYQGIVTKIINETYDNDPLVPAIERFSQTVEVKLLSGPDEGKFFELSFVPGSTGNAEHNLKTNEKVLIIRTAVAEEINYYIADRYRLNKVIWLALGFFILVILFAGWKGFSSLLGLASTIVIILWYILPRIVAGHDPFLTFLFGGLIITATSIYLGHGFNRRTSVAVISTAITLIISIGIAIFAINWTKLFGLGTEEAFYIQVGAFANLNLKGLLLGGIIIGILGVLDDITTAQSAAVEEIHRANPALNFNELIKRGLSVGHEHIISLVNTLVLAYVGASFPLLLLFTQAYTPLWVALNSEIIIEEIVRTLIGSSALVFAVPITTYLAAYCYTKYPAKKSTANNSSSQ